MRPCTAGTRGPAPSRTPLRIHPFGAGSTSPGVWEATAPPRPKTQSQDGIVPPVSLVSRQERPGHPDTPPGNPGTCAPTQGRRRAGELGGAT